MTYNYHEVFAEVDKRLSKDPSLRLYALSRRLGCSHPTIEKAVFQNTSLSFRAFQQKKLLERILRLLEEGHTSKEIGLELGYKWPENFTRFVKKSTGCSPFELSQNRLTTVSIMSSRK